jgi:hypothetical protein
MGAFAGPEITSDGLVLALDAGNSKGFDDDENLALNSEAINSWANNGNAISISANSQIAPDGTLTADVLSQTAVTGASRWVSSMTRTYTAGVTYTLSIWLKKISGTDAQPTINLWVNGGTNQSVGTITTEWVRYSKSFTPASTISSSTFTGLNIGWSDTGVANNFTFAAWGFQVETSSSASPYYPTTGTAKNRGTTWTDLSGNGNTGTLTNGPTFNSGNGGSLSFDGSNDYATIEANSSFQLGNGYTLCAWVKASNNPGNYAGICGTFDVIPSAYFGSNFSIQPSTQTFYFLVGGSSTYYIPALTTYTIGQWYYLIGTISGAECKFYINGTLNTTYTQPSASSAPGATTKFKMGRFYQNTDNYYFNGNIATCKFYNRALTAQEIQQNFNATRSRYSI